MKKFVIFTLIIAMAAGAAFAQTANGISVNAWGRGVFAPLAVVTAPQSGGEAIPSVIDPDGDDIPSINYAGAGVTWGGTKVRTDFRVNGNADFIGFVINLTEDGVDAGDNAFIWAKPFSSDALKLSVGKFDVDDLRGKVNTDTGFEDFAVPAKMDEDAIFNRFRAGNGFMLSSQPVDGLFIGLRVNGDLFRNWNGDGGSLYQDWDDYDGAVVESRRSTKLMDAYRFMQLGFGYDIADVGHIRAQWVGGWFGTIDPEKVAEDMGKSKYDIEAIGYEDWADPSWAAPGNGMLINQARIEAAFALTSVQNLLVDLGLKFWLPIEFKEEYKLTQGIDVNVGAKFRADAFQIIGQVGANFGSYFKGVEDDDSAGGIGLNVNLIPSYDLDAFTIGASIGLKLDTAGKDSNGDAIEDADKMALGFGGFVSKGLGSGSVKAGLTFKTAPTVGGKAEGSGVFTIPVILEYAFF